MKLDQIIPLTERMGPFTGVGSWSGRKDNPFDSDTKYFVQQAGKGLKKLGKKLKNKLAKKK